MRSKRLLALSDKKTEAFYAAHIGKMAVVLCEKSRQGMPMHGFTDNYIRVELSPRQTSEDYDNKLIKVVLGDFNHDRTSLKAEFDG